MLNLHSEKVSECAFQSALHRTAQAMPNVTIIDYTVCENVHYEAAVGKFRTSCSTIVILLHDHDTVAAHLSNVTHSGL